MPRRKPDNPRAHLPKPSQGACKACGELGPLADGYCMDCCVEVYLGVVKNWNVPICGRVDPVREDVDAWAKNFSDDA